MKLAIGCVADSTPKYLDQAERLLQSWRWFAGRYAEAEFHVCVVGEPSADTRARYERYAAKVHVVERMSERHPPSNKLRFLEIEPARTAERTVLLDCDTVVVQEPSALFAGEALIAKMGDYATVPAAVFERLSARFGVALPDADFVCTVSRERSIPYFNAGVLSFSSQAMRELAPAWRRFNDALLHEPELLGECLGFCDQASLAMAVAATRTPFTLLDNALNFPAHFVDEPIDSDFGQTDPVIIHYHWLTDAQSRLLPSRFPNVNRRIGEYNARAAQERAQRS